MRAGSVVALAGVVIGCLLEAPATGGRRAARTGLGFRPGVLLVQFDLDQGFNARSQRVHRQFGSTVIHTYRAINWQLVRLRPGVTVEDAERKYRGHPLVLHTARDYYRRLDSVPDDHRYGDQPELDIIGAPAAWNSTHGDSRNIIAVIDTGARLDHPDLREQLWINSGEGTVTNGADDDGNGYIDDIHGVFGLQWRTPPEDDHGHGTHCSGIAAAHTNNGEGVASLSWGARLMVLKALDQHKRYISDSHAIECLSYVIAERKNTKAMKIVSISWGEVDNSSALSTAFAELSERGLFVACSAGNKRSDNDTVPHFPSNYDVPGLVAVAANDGFDEPADEFTNYGRRRVHLAAPGVGILSTCAGVNYCYKSGTSMAAPSVAAAAALVFARYPHKSADQVKRRLIATASRQSGWSGRSVSEGRLNIDRAINEPW